MADPKTAVNLTALYSDLNKFGQNEDYARAIKVAQKSKCCSPQDSVFFAFCEELVVQNAVILIQHVLVNLYSFWQLFRPVQMSRRLFTA